MADQDINETVYGVLDRVLAGGPVSPGAKGRIYRVIDALRLHPAERVQSEIAEHISVQLHRFEHRLHERDQEGSETVRGELKRLAAQWLKANVGGKSGPRSKQAALAHPLSRDFKLDDSDLALQCMVRRSKPTCPKQTPVMP